MSLTERIEDCVWHWALATPDAIAITDGGRPVTYSELAALAGNLSERLRRAGAGPEVLVALSAGRSAELVAGIVGILRSGSAYVPIDPSYPQERRAFLMEDSRCPILVTEKRFADSFPHHHGSLIILDDESADRIVEPAEHQATSDNPADPLAYIIYTSGSTGKPKGVQITHHNVLRLLSQTERWYGFGPNDVWSLFHSFSFDVSVFEIWGAFHYGGRLVVVPQETTRDPIAFRRLVRVEEVTVLSQTPSAFRMFLQADALLNPAGSDALRYIIFAGEALELRLLQSWFDRHGDRRPLMVNMYGTTETTVHATFRIITERDAREARSLIGVPIPDLTLHVLDGNRQPVAMGEEGEIWIGGEGVGRGYWNHPELTAERFVPDPFSNASGARLYRTGDLARLCPDGELEYLGRLDQQVKLRGFRVELGEIEALLRAAAANVADAVVLLRKDPHGEDTLTAYLVRGAAGGNPDMDAIEASLKRQLPDYMCPTAYAVLDALPLTSNGKLDRGALPAPMRLRPDTVTDATPLEGVELEIGRLFDEILGLDVSSLGAGSNFFHLGGTSLQAMKLALRIAERFNRVALPPGAVFRHPTLAALARAVEDAVQQTPLLSAPSPDESTSWQRLSPTQEQFWLVQRMNPETTAFNCPMAYRTEGQLDIPRLAAAIEVVCRRHSALRTVFGFENGRPVQRVVPDPVFGLKVESGCDVRSIVNRPLELSVSSASATLVRHSENDHTLVVVIHHVITDGWSLALLAEEIGQFYACGAHSEPLPHQFPEFAAYQRRQLESQEMFEDEAFWRDRLAGAPSASGLPAEFPRPPISVFRRGRRAFEIPGSLGLAAAAKRLDCTPNTLLLAAFAAALWRYDRQEMLVLGIPYAGRDGFGSERVHGLFMNLLALGIRFASSGITFAELVREVKETSSEAYRHSALPFSRLVQLLEIPRESNRQPLMQTMFAPQAQSRNALILPGIAVSPVDIDLNETCYDLALCTWPHGDGFEAEFVYAADLYSQDAIQGFQQHFARILASGLDEPEKPIGELDILSAEERGLLLDEWSGRGHVHEPAKSFLTLFGEAVQADPGHLAIQHDRRRVTYGELDRWSNRIAHSLIARGIGRNSLVAVRMERSPEALASILGIWKAGGAYLPLDTACPSERLAWMLEDSAAQLMIVSRGCEDTCATPILSLDNDSVEDSGCATGVSNGPDELAYVIYTSGSTGTPKGVMIEHGALAALAHAVRQAYPLGRDERLLQYVSLSFDVSIGEIVCALTQGATMVIPKANHFLAGIELLDVLESQRISQVLMPALVLSQLEPRPLPDLRRIISGGERLPAEVADRWCRDFTLVNAYGPTEATVGATAHNCIRCDGEPPIGRPLLGYSVYALDESGRLVPPGAIGELYIGGPGLARGYLNQPELTAARFLSHGTPAVPERLYRTGDMVRWRRRDGALEFLGRTDGQHKIRGYRIEAGEIESAVREIEGVQDAAVVVAGEGSQARILACAVPRSGARLEESSVRDALSRRLPAQMVPSRVAILPGIPMTINGKVDRAALLRLVSANSPKQASAASSNGSSGTVAKIWQAVLGHDVDRHVNFFDAGGNSLLMIDLQTRLSAAFGRHVGVAELFANPTIEALERLLTPESESDSPACSSRSTEAGDASNAIAIVGMAARFPKAPGLKAYWDLLCNGVDGITRENGSEGKPGGYVAARGLLEGADTFDANLFEMPAHEAERLDPQHRIWLECALAALEDASCDPRQFNGRIGVFTGVGSSNYQSQWPNADESDYHLAIGSDKDFVATRTSYKLGLTGPSLAVQTACSTSLVAVHLACRHLLSLECDAAIAGAASVSIPFEMGYRFREGMILSPDGVCRPFDSRANGTVPSDGVGAVVLKRLCDAIEDGDDIYAVIAGSAINNDGADKVGYTAPSVHGQSLVVSAALAAAGMTADAITYVEAHGTGTHMGDPIEFAALRQVFEVAGAPAGRCLISSVKGDIGHTNTAAGVAGLIKAALAIRHRRIPGTRHFASPNPELQVEQSPFRIQSSLEPWEPGITLAAGVSSFGIGGTNAHVILTEPPAIREPLPAAARPELFPISGATESAVISNSRLVGNALDAPNAPGLASVACTLQQGRAGRQYRGFIIARNHEHASRELRALSPHRVTRVEGRPAAIALLFPGQGAQFPAMGRALAAVEPAFAAQLRKTDAVMRASAGIPLLDLIESGAPLEDTDLVQPILFGLEYSLAHTLASCGIQPAAMLGHSLGEYTAACIAQVFSLEEASRLVTARGRLMQQTEPGAMLSVAITETELLPYLDEFQLDLAAVNGKAQCVVSGAVLSVENLRARLKDQGIESRRLRTNRAFHSRLTDPILDDFRRVVRKVALRLPAKPFLSSVTGDWITPAECADPEYWVRQVRQPVRFHDALGRLLERTSLLLEAGPGERLCAFVKRHQGRLAAHSAFPLLGKAGTCELEHWLSAVGSAWAAGHSINWGSHWEGRDARATHLPAYAFERRRYWPGAKATETQQESPNDWVYAPRWVPASPATDRRPDASVDRRRWIVFANSEAVCSSLIANLGADTVAVRCGGQFQQIRQDEYLVVPGERASIDRMFEQASVDASAGVVFAWSLDGADCSVAGIDETLRRTYFTLVAIIQALAARASQGARIEVLTRGIDASPPAAMLGGFVVSAIHEYPGIHVRQICVEDYAAAVPQILEELHSLPADDETLVTLDSGGRWIRSFELAAAGTPGVSRIRNGGVYLITGGLGGVGLTLAEHLARHYHARLVLVSRSGLKGIEGDLSETIRRREIFEQVKRHAGGLVVHTADVSLADGAQSAVERAISEYGRIDGVIHAAGATGGGAIQIRTADQSLEILRAKVHGTLHLEAALEGVDHEFLFLCSSLTAVSGGYGQADYAAANAFLDAYAGVATTPARRVVSVNWDGWREVGAHARHVEEITERASNEGDDAASPEITTVANSLIDGFDSGLRGGAYRTIVTGDHWYAAEHMVEGEPILPGTFFLEVAIQSGLAEGLQFPLHIEELDLLAPFPVLPGGGSTLYTFPERRG